MQIFLTHARFGEFENAQGEKIRFSNIMGLHHENVNEEDEKGQKTVKMKASPSVVRSLGSLPAMYECDIMPSTNGVEIVKAVQVK